MDVEGDMELMSAIVPAYTTANAIGVSYPPS